MTAAPSSRSTRNSASPRSGSSISWAAAVEVYRQPKEGAYASRERRTSGALAPALVPGVDIDVAALLA